MGLVNIQSADLEASINEANQQLCSLRYDGKEFLHDGGMPTELQVQPRRPDDWQNTELTMFPPGKAKNNLYVAGKRNSDQYAIGQHGVPRHCTWSLVAKTSHCVRYMLEHQAHSIVRNTKRGPHTEPDFMRWPYSFTLEKEFSLLPSALVTLFKITNTDSQPQPYAIGWHPAFSIPEGGMTFDVPGVERSEIPPNTDRDVLDTHAVLRTKEHVIDITSDFGRLHLWRPGSASFVCVEPITAPMLAEGYTTLLPPHGRILAPGASAVYTATLRFSRR